MEPFVLHEINPLSTPTNGRISKPDLTSNQPQDKPITHADLDTTSTTYWHRRAPSGRPRYEGASCPVGSLAGEKTRHRGGNANIGQYITGKVGRRRECRKKGKCSVTVMETPCHLVASRVYWSQRWPEETDTLGPLDCSEP